MTLLLNPTLGLAQIQRAALAQIFAGLNSVIDEIDERFADDDVAFETFLGREDPQATTTEHVPDANFHEGHRPSLVTAPISEYPNVCVWTVSARPHDESANSDHTDIFNDLLYVEVMAKAAPGEDEEVVNRRVNRMVEAVHIVISKDKTLGGKVPELSQPTVTLSDVFLRRERTSSGPQWSWQGARIEYAARKDAVLPSSTPGSIFQAVQVSTPIYPGADIDQF